MNWLTSGNYFDSLNKSWLILVIECVEREQFKERKNWLDIHCLIHILLLKNDKFISRKTFILNW